MNSHIYICIYIHICIYIFTYIVHAHIYTQQPSCGHGTYGGATMSKLLKTYFSFAEYHLFYRALLQKRPMILRSLPVIHSHTISVAFATSIHLYIYTIIYVCTNIYLQTHVFEYIWQP